MEITISDKLALLITRRLLIGILAILLFDVVVRIIEVGTEVANIGYNRYLGNSDGGAEDLIGALYARITFSR